MKATKTKAGTWRVQVGYRKPDGQLSTKSITAATKKEAEILAAQWQADHIQQANDGKLHITFAEAAKRYIASRENVLSPSTIREYNRAAATAYKVIDNIGINDLTREQIQLLVNVWAETKGPKTIRNYHGFLSAVLKVYRPDFVLTTKLPQPVKPQLYTPSDADIQKLLAHVAGTRLEIPVMLAALSSLRRSEVCALDASDIGDGFINVTKAMVMGPDNSWHIKTTKSVDGTRVTYLPIQVTNKIKALVPEGRVVEMNPSMLTHAFEDAVKAAGLPHFRFHALRSYYASILHSLGVPDRYIMQWGGWHDQGTLQMHYERVLPDKIPEFAQVGVDHFTKILGNND